MKSMIPLFIIMFPYALITSFVINSKGKIFSRLLNFAGLLLGWTWILLCLVILKQIPVLSQFLVGISAFSLPLLLLWRTSALDWVGENSRRVRWGITCTWTLLWYLLFDPSGFSLITWVMIWPIILLLAWKAYDSQERGPIYFLRAGWKKLRPSKEIPTE